MFITLKTNQNSTYCHFVIIIFIKVCHFVIILRNVDFIYFIHFQILKTYKNEKKELRHTFCLKRAENKNKKPITIKKGGNYVTRKKK